MFGHNNNQQPAAAQQPAAVKGFTYRCNTACTFQGKFRKEGETIVLQEKKEVPHFELVEK